MNRATQLARGAITAAVAIVLAGFSHGVAGGEAPGDVGLVFAFLVALAASVAFIGRRTTPVRVALAVIVSQGAFHLLFGVSAGGPDRLLVTGSGHHQVVTVVDGVAPAAHAAHSDLAMLAGHALAAALTIVYLLAVENAAWRSLAVTARRFASRLTGEVPPVPVVTAPRRPAAAFASPVLRTQFLRSALRSRGPPARPAFA
ncbi:hypothetical protein [Agromyces bauzanensis]